MKNLFIKLVDSAVSINFFCNVDLPVTRWQYIEGSIHLKCVTWGLALRNLITNLVY